MKKINLILFGMLFVLSPVFNSTYGQNERSEILATMTKWKAAVESQNIDAIVEFYSDDFTSQDGEGKEGAREMWNELKELGYLEKIEVSLDNMTIEIADDVAEIKMFDSEGEPTFDFSLENEDGEGWLITGIPSEECSYEQYASEYGDDCVQHDGYYRCWDIYVPPNLTVDVPLLIDIHGWGSSPAEQKEWSQFETIAEDEGFIIVRPYGLCNSWNSGEKCCPPASLDEVDDVGFIRKMIAKLSGKYSIDKSKIYVTGLSNGCSMTQRLANEASDVITAAACMALHLLVPQNPDYDPIPVMTLLGTKDDLYYESDEMPGAVKNFETWKEMNNCTGSYEVTWQSGNSVAWTYTDCENETEVTLVTIDGGGHILYKGVQTEINTTRLAWDFLKRFSK